MAKITRGGTPGYNSPEAHAYRKAAGNSPTPASAAQPSVPASFPVAHHRGGQAQRAIETVGWPGDGKPFKESTAPNSSRKVGTDGVFSGDIMRPNGQEWSAAGRPKPSTAGRPRPSGKTEPHGPLDRQSDTIRKINRKKP